MGLAATALACPLVALDDPADSGAMSHRVVVQVLLLAYRSIVQVLLDFRWIIHQT